MATPFDDDESGISLSLGVVLAVTEADCSVWSHGSTRTVRFAPVFPSPRVDRVSPGHLVAIATAPGGAEAVVWRWYDALVLGAGEADAVRLWEPGHGEVSAASRDSRASPPPGSRVWASAGLPGADWWVVGPTSGTPEAAPVELDAVRELYTDHGLWPSVFPSKDAAPRAVPQAWVATPAT